MILRRRAAARVGEIGASKNAPGWARSGSSRSSATSGRQVQAQERRRIGVLRRHATAVQCGARLRASVVRLGTMSRLNLKLNDAERAVLLYLLGQERAGTPAKRPDAELHIHDSLGGAAGLDAFSRLDTRQVIEFLPRGKGLHVRLPGVLALEGAQIDEIVGDLERVATTLEGWYRADRDATRRRSDVVAATGLSDLRAGQALLHADFMGLILGGQADEQLGYPDTFRVAFKAIEFTSIAGAVDGGRFRSFEPRPSAVERAAQTALSSPTGANLGSGPRPAGGEATVESEKTAPQSCPRCGRTTTVTEVFLPEHDRVDQVRSCPSTVCGFKERVERVPYHTWSKSHQDSWGNAVSRRLERKLPVRCPDCGKISIAGEAIAGQGVGAAEHYQLMCKTSGCAFPTHKIERSIGATAFVLIRRVALIAVLLAGAAALAYVFHRVYSSGDSTNESRSAGDVDPLQHPQPPVREPTCVECCDFIAQNAICEDEGCRNGVNNAHGECVRNCEIGRTCVLPVDLRGRWRASVSDPLGR